MSTARIKALVMFLLLTLLLGATLRAQNASTWRYVQKALDTDDEKALIAFMMVGVPSKGGPDFHDTSVRLAAISKIKSQPALMNYIASGRSLRDAAFDLTDAVFFNVTDQSALRGFIGNKENRIWNRRLAVRRLTDPDLLKEIALRGEDRGMRAAAISVLQGSEDVLRALAGEARVPATDGIAACARIRLILREPLMRDRFPDTEVLVRYATDSAKYAPATIARIQTENAFDVSGESFRLTVRQKGMILAESFWSTYFAYNRADSRSCQVVLQDLLVQLLDKPCFTASDIAEISKSEFAELREATDFFAGHLHQAQERERYGPGLGLWDYAESIGKMMDGDKLAQLGQERERGFFSLPLLARQRLAAIKAVEGIEDDEALRGLALKNAESFTGLAAVEKMQNKDLLLGLYLEMARQEVLNDESLLTAIQRRLGDQWLTDKGVFERKEFVSPGRTRYKEEPAHRLIRHVLDRETLNRVVLNRRINGKFRFAALVRMMSLHLGMPDYSK
jgi:hypothetical protein